jgi:hypothetical protein
MIPRAVAMYAQYPTSCPITDFGGTLNFRVGSMTAVCNGGAGQVIAVWIDARCVGLAGFEGVPQLTSSAAALPAQTVATRRRAVVASRCVAVMGEQSIGLFTRPTILGTQRDIVTLIVRS